MTTTNISSAVMENEYRTRAPKVTIHLSNIVQFEIAEKSVRIGNFLQGSHSYSGYDISRTDIQN